MFLALGIIANSIFATFLLKFHQLKLDFILVFTSSTAILIYWISVFAIYTILISFLTDRIRKALEARRERIEEEKQVKEYAEKLIEKRTDYLKLEELEKLLSELKDLDSYLPGLTEKIENVKERIVEEKKKEKIKLLREEKERLEESIKEKRRIEDNLKRKLEDNRQAILGRLEIYDNYVFKKDEISDKEIDALKSAGYTSENEFCVLEQRRINVLIKPPTNHSVHHTFLVWSVKRLLEKNRKITHINEHLSVEADITFKFENKMFAIEVETGSLLRKKEQLQEKVGYLKRKYSDRWIFLISNKKLLSKYNKFGLTATRKDMVKKLEKLLKN